MKISPPSTISGVFSATSICVTVDHRHVIFEIFRIKCHAPPQPTPHPRKNENKNKNRYKNKKQTKSIWQNKNKNGYGRRNSNFSPLCWRGGGSLICVRKVRVWGLFFIQFLCFLINVLNPAEVWRTEISSTLGMDSLSTEKFFTGKPPTHLIKIAHSTHLVITTYIPTGITRIRRYEI